MPFRVLKYTTNIINQHLKNAQSKHIPLVFPLVLYHGEKPWNYSTDIRDLVNAPKELVDAYFLKPFSLIDLSQIEDKVLKERVWAGAMELILKHIFAPDILLKLKDILALLKQIYSLEGSAFTEAALVYIMEEGQLTDNELFFNIIQTELSQEIGEKVMTIAEQLRLEGKKEGWKEGVEKGIEQGKMEKTKQIARQLLASQMDAKFVANITGLSFSELEALREKL